MVAIEVTEEQIQAANVELEEILKSKSLSRSKLLKINTRLSLAIQQKQALTKELKDLEKNDLALTDDVYSLIIIIHVQISTYGSNAHCFLLVNYFTCT